MKKVLIASAVLFFAAVTNVNAQVDQKSEKKETMEKKDVVEKTQQTNQQTKTPVKPEALPEAIKATTTGEDFKGWVINSAFLVKTTTSEFYEVVFTKEKETRTVNFDKAGKPMA